MILTFKKMNSLTFLLVEDDEIEKLKFKRILTKLNSNHKCIEADNGEDALSKIDNGLLPDIILLDLNMPKMGGIDFIKHFKQNDHLKYIPIIILTTSCNFIEIKTCYAKGASGYIIKPLQYEDYIEKINALIQYWEHNEIIKT